MWPKMKLGFIRGNSAILFRKREYIYRIFPLYFIFHILMKIFPPKKTLKWWCAKIGNTNVQSRVFVSKDRE